MLSPAKAVWGSFSCAGEYAGSFVRFIEEQENNQGIINSDRGAWESIVFEVTENESGAAVTNDS